MDICGFCGGAQDVEIEIERDGKTEYVSCPACFGTGFKLARGSISKSTNDDATALAVAAFERYVRKHGAP